MTDATTNQSPAADDAAIVEARRRAGKAIRELGHAFVGRHATLQQIEHLADAVEAINDELWPQQHRSGDDRSYGDDLDDHPQGRFISGFDDRPVSGRSSPWGLDIDLHRHGDEIEALVTLRSAHEGAPGRSHGGVVAALFDDVFGFVLGILREPAFTGDLYVRYHAPTPLFRELSCRARFVDRDGRKLHFTGELTDVESGRIVASSRATFITVDPEVIQRLTAARPAPPDEGG